MRDLTIEFRLKKCLIYDDLFTYIRATLLIGYTGADRDMVKYSLPSSIQFEQLVLKYCIECIQGLIERYGLYFDGEYSFGKSLKEDIEALDHISMQEKVDNKEIFHVGVV